MQGNLHAGHDVLLQSQFRDEEIVNDVAGVHDELDVFADRDLQGGAHDIVFTGGIFVVETQRIAGGIVDQFQVGVAEFSVGSGVAESPRKLLGGDFHQDRIGGSFIEVDARPDL